MEQNKQFSNWALLLDFESIEKIKKPLLYSEFAEIKAKYQCPVIFIDGHAIFSSQDSKVGYAHKTEEDFLVKMESDKKTRNANRKKIQDSN